MSNKSKLKQDVAHLRVAWKEAYDTDLYDYGAAMLDMMDRAERLGYLPASELTADEAEFMMEVLLWT